MEKSKMALLYYKKHVKDKKHSVEFDKDKISYKGHTFDAVIAKNLRAHIEEVMKNNNLEYPLLIEVVADPAKKYYFTKPKAYNYTDPTTGEVVRKVKTSITLLKCDAITQGEFEGGKSLDDIVDAIDEEEDED